MRNKWLEPTRNFLWRYSPLWYTDIDNRVYYESENYYKKYIQSPCAILIIFFCDSSDPDKKKHKSSPENDALTEYLDDMC